MKHKLLRRGASLLAAVVLAISLITAPAMADEPASFGMSVASVRAGEATKLTEIDPCPAPTSGSQWDWHVNVSFTDANGEVSLWNVPVDEQGHWVSPIWMTPPHTRVLSYDPLTYSSGAALGVGSIQAWCQEDGQTTLEYETQALTVSGTSAAFKVSSGFLKTGEPVHLESTTPCPAGSASMDGWMDVGTIGYYPFSAELDADGGWSVDFTIPADFPVGVALIDAFCHPPGDPNNRTQVYTQSFALIGTGEFNYLAWGDSYSSGEGVEPFEAGTEGESSCRRSVNAYPRLLEQDPSLRLELGSSFVACQGATISAITSGYNNQGAQLDMLTAETDLITMTIGGNDVPFRNFATACIMPGVVQCNEGPHGDALAGIVNNVISQMEEMLGAVHNRLMGLGNSNASVLIIGYPQLMPEVWTANSAGCWWLQPQELPTIREVTESLNTAIKNEVEAIGGNFHFVSATEPGSPFIGHELCRDASDTMPSYFRNYDSSAPEAYTFHPNEQGQQAYASLVKAFLNQHPLG